MLTGIALPRLRRVRAPSHGVGGCDHQQCLSGRDQSERSTIRPSNTRRSAPCWRVSHCCCSGRAPAAYFRRVGTGAGPRCRGDQHRVWVRGHVLSVRMAGAAIPGVVASSQVLLIAPFAALLFGERLGRGRLLGLLLGIVGVGLTVSGSPGGLGEIGGISLALMAAAGVAAGNLVTKLLGSRVDALTATAWQYLIGGGFLLAASVPLDGMDPVRWSAASSLVSSSSRSSGPLGPHGPGFAWSPRAILSHLPVSRSSRRASCSSSHLSCIESRDTARRGGSPDDTGRRHISRVACEAAASVTSATGQQEELGHVPVTRSPVSSTMG